MAAKPMNDSRPSGAFTVKQRDFNRMMTKLDNPPKASSTLRAFVTTGRTLIAKKS